MVVDPADVLTHIDKEDLGLETENLEYQSRVDAAFPQVFTAWMTHGDIDPYTDGVDDEVARLAAEWGLVPDVAHDVFSACAHTIRMAVERLTGQDPCSSPCGLTLAGPA